jgi:hypothetical protein
MCLAGTFIVVPDVSQLGFPAGNKAEISRQAFQGNAATGGVGGILLTTDSGGMCSHPKTIRPSLSPSKALLLPGEQAAVVR